MIYGKKIITIAIPVIVCLAIVYVLAAQLSSLNHFVSSWDQVDFTLAIDRFDLRAMQPHFPGYPFFIFGGMLLNIFVQEQQIALVVFNILFYGSTLVPIYFLALRIVPKQAALLVASALYTASYPLIIVNQPMSEGAALAAFWWYFFSVVVAAERRIGYWTLLPLFMFSLLLGIRLSYIPLGIGLIYLFYQKWSNNEISLRGLVKYVLIAGVFQFVWVGALVLNEGGVTSFLELAFGFTGGHFHDWGGTAASNELSLLARIRLFFFTNVFWWGIFSKNTILMLLYIVIGLFLFVPNKSSRIVENRTFRLGAAMMIAYGIWALFAQNIDKPRHILPVAVLLVFLVTSSFLLKVSKRTGTSLIICLVLFQAYTAAQYIKSQADEVPAVYQLAGFLEDRQEEFVLYTWEETRVLDYLQVDFPHKRVFTYKIFQHDSSLYKGRNIYLTDSIVEGFRSQGVDVETHLKKINEFHSTEIFDPVYHEISLYKWIP